MTARDAQRLSDEELQFELQYTYDQIKRLIGQINEVRPILRSIMVKELRGYKSIFNIITQEFYRRYIP